MKVSQLIPVENISIGWPAKEIPRTGQKWSLISDIVAFLAKKEHLTKKQENIVLESINSREKSMTTAVGQGIAVPHAGLEFLSKPMASLTVIPDGINFESLDKKPVYLIFLVLIPQKNYKKYIQTLSNILFIAQNADWEAKILGLETKKEVWNQLVHLEE